VSCVGVALLGTGSASHPLRGQSSVLLDDGDSVVLVDVGCGSWKTLFRLGYEIRDITAIVVTHSHMDHVCSLPHLAFLAGFKAPGKELTVYSPGGLHRRVVEALLEAGSATSGSRFTVREVGEGEAFTVGSASFKPVPALHFPGSLSYVIHFPRVGVKVAVSGDTAPSEAFAAEARGSALVVHEATFPAGMGVEAVEAGHTSVDQALSLPLEAEELVLYHLSVESERSAVEYSRAGGARRLVVPSDGYMERIC